MDEKRLIGNYLCISGFEDFDKENRKTTLSIALSGARYFSGRDINTGKLKSEHERVGLTISNIENGILYSSQFLAVTSYLIILDLIGCLFKRNSINKNSRDSFEHALDNFTKLSVGDKNALKALRNSLAHNFGLGTTSHIFSLSSDYENMILLPKAHDAWYASKSDKERSRTLVNDLLLCDFVESIINQLPEDFANGDLGLKKGVTEVTLMSNFTIL